MKRLRCAPPPRLVRPARSGNQLKKHHSPAEILAAEEPLLKQEPVNCVIEDQRMFEVAGNLHVENLSKLPLDRCVKTNRPVAKIVIVGLRNPLNPLTWWGKKSRQFMVGLTARAYEDYRTKVVGSRVCLFFAGLALPLAFFVYPLFFLSAAGLLIVAAGLLNSTAVVWSSHSKRRVTVLHGLCRDFVRDTISVN